MKSGRIADLIAILIALELAGLAALRYWWNLGPPIGKVIGSSAAGIFLLLALKMALIGASWPWIAGFLAASLPAHIADLGSRWNE